MKRIRVVMMVGCFGITAFAGDTNFVAQFDAIWQTRNASNILVFVEQNVATNKSPETLFARGIVANTLQLWTQGATNYWEQAAQLISTNTVYAELERTTVAKEIRGHNVFIAATLSNNSPPSWDSASHTLFFSALGDKPLYFDILERIAAIKSAGK
jgi:hypothetical protein